MLISSETIFLLLTLEDTIPVGALYSPKTSLMTFDHSPVVHTFVGALNRNIHDIFTRFGFFYFLILEKFNNFFLFLASTDNILYFQNFTFIYFLLNPPSFSDTRGEVSPSSKQLTPTTFCIPVSIFFCLCVCDITS